MLKKTCQNCGSIIELNEDNYTPGEDVKVECQLCGEEAIFTIPVKKNDEPKTDSPIVVTGVVKGVKKRGQDSISSKVDEAQTSSSAPIVQAKAKPKNVVQITDSTATNDKTKESKTKNTGNTSNNNANKQKNRQKKKDDNETTIGCFLLLFIIVAVCGYFWYDSKQQEMQKTYEQLLAQERESAKEAQEEAERANAAKEAAEREQQELQRKIKLTQEFAGTYKGTIDGKYEVTLTLRADNTKVTGEYYYDSGQNGTLRLEGSIEGVQLVMKEFNRENEVCGTWRCRKDNNSILGQMTNSNGTTYSVNVIDINELSAQETYESSSMSSSSHPSYIRVTGERVRLRRGPSIEADIVKYTNGDPVYPNKGDVLECIGETDEWYKIKYQDTYTFYISKQFTEPY